MLSDDGDAELSANHLPLPPATRIITPLEFNQHRMRNEEAIGSDYSLSRNVCHSVRSTSTSSLSNHQTSLNTEWQSSGRQPFKRIEFLAFPSCDNHNNSFDDKVLLPVPAGTNQHHDPTTLARNMGEHSPTSQPAKVLRLITQESLHAVHQYLLTFDITSHTTALFALSLTTFNLRHIGVQVQHSRIWIVEKIW